MSEIKKIVREYSTQKLKEIIETQYASYSETFIDFAKDELIKRGEKFRFNSDYEKEIASMNDGDLKNLVEKEWNEYHLEYLEIARIEYIRRNFKNESTDYEQSQREVPIDEKRYPTLWSIIRALYIGAFIILFVSAITSIFSLSQLPSELGPIFAILNLVGGVFVFLLIMAISEMIKVVIDIEENTRKNI